MLFKIFSDNNLSPFFYLLHFLSAPTAQVHAALYSMRMISASPPPALLVPPGQCEEICSFLHSRRRPDLLSHVSLLLLSPFTPSVRFLGVTPCQIADDFFLVFSEINSPLLILALCER